MAYTRPAANAVNESWQGIVAYARPAANAANENFAPTYQVSGFAPVHFGTPWIVQHPVSGFAPVSFGNIIVKPLPATGFAPVNFGAPAILAFYPATGFAPVAFGTPVLILRALGFAATRFGTPVDLQASGFKPTHLGAITVRQVNRDSAWRAVSFGTPAVAVLDVVACDGFIPVRFGRATAIRFTGTTLNRRVFVYAGLRPVKHFGVPTV
jgi:hypothetical protein